MSPPNNPNQQNAAPTDQSNPLSTATCLTRPEVLTRRVNNFRRLSNIYKDEYWHLMGELRNAHREYVAIGLNPFHEEEPELEVEEEEEPQPEPAPEPEPDNSICAFEGCQTRPMPLTPFCFAHILSDPRQVLYKPCEFVIASAQAGQAGPVTCRKPILSTRVPAYCNVHMQLGQMHLTRALQGEGLNISSASQVQPQLHHLIAEFVRQIQAKRRKVRTEEECKSVFKKEDDATSEG